jgi:hypothetical protein
MRKLIVASLVALPLLGGVAFADTQSDTGVIKHINVSKGTLQLADGKTFSVPKSIKLGGFKPSEKVMVNYTMANGKMLATSVTAAK